MNQTCRLKLRRAFMMTWLINDPALLVTTLAFVIAVVPNPHVVIIGEDPLPSATTSVASAPGRLSASSSSVIGSAPGTVSTGTDIAHRITLSNWLLAALGES